MGTLERKQRELKAREALILDEARRLFLADGYFGLSMDRLAEAIEYSKPTIYAHFETKEDILLALCNESLRRRVELFHRASAFPGNPRERMTAIGVADVVFVHHYREHYEIERMMKTASLWAKASEARREELLRLEAICLGPIHGIIGEAIAAGDFDLRRADPSDIGEGLRALSLGTHLFASLPNRTPEEVSRLYRQLRRNQLRFLDGAGWKPLTHKWNYADTVARIYKTVFPSEVSALPASLHDLSDLDPSKHQPPPP